MMDKRIKRSISAIILAAGSGSRMRSDTTKQQMKILGRPILSYTLEAFDSADTVSYITVVARAEELDFVSDLLSSVKKPNRVIVGGKSRAESAVLGFKSLNDEADFVAIHDAARCLITPEDIDRVAESAFVHGCATAVMRVVDTVKRVDENGFIISTENRDNLRRAATPQIFSKGIYSRAVENTELINENITDDNMLVQINGGRIACVDTDDTNIKITVGSDILLAEGILNERKSEKGESVSMMRVGHGYDVHKIVSGRKMILGGVEIPYEKGLLGHSDADVLVHAIMDALLGAAALGDIGRHFPDTEEAFKDASSINLLVRVKKLVEEKGYKISNVDATLVLQAPKVSSYIEKMRENVAFALNIGSENVNIKATTEEKLGFTGSGDGAAAHAIALLEK